MNKKMIIPLFFLLALLVSITVVYTILTNDTTSDNIPDTGENIDEDTLTTEVDSTFLDENQEIEIGEMI